jgi:hypothetical protein
MLFSPLLFYLVPSSGTTNVMQLCQTEYTYSLLYWCTLNTTGYPLPWLPRNVSFLIVVPVNHIH